MPNDMLTTQRFLDDVVASFADRFAIDQGPPGGLLPYAELLERVAGCRAVLPTSIDRIDEQVFANTPSLKVVANVGVGYNHIDVPAATKRGIWVTNTPGVLTDSVADMAMALMLSTLRRISDGSEHVRHGHWHDNRQDTFWGADPRTMTLGILGFGAIGQAVARRARPFGFRIIYHKRTRLTLELERELDATYVPFDELIETSDVLSLHVPLTDETRGRIGRAELARMRRGSFIINTARGGVIDEPALIDALADGQIAGLGADVTATEPDVPQALREHPRALIMPHVASATRGTRGGMMRMALENAAAVLDGKRPPNPVNQPE
jgi:lactate dehydrogenase-like 2-hydroxyacid dehydrogenase